MTILVTCSACDTDNRVEPLDMIVHFSESPGEPAAELLFDCGACGCTPVQRVPKELAAVVVFRGAASLTGVGAGLWHPDTAAPAPDTAVLSVDDLLELHLALQDHERMRCVLDELDRHDC